MLQAPTNDRKTKVDASAKTAEQLPEQEQSLQLMGGMGRSWRSHSSQQRGNLAALQKAYGNQAVLRMRQVGEEKPNEVSEPKSSSARRLTMVEQNKQSISATIRRVNKPHSSHSKRLSGLNELLTINRNLAGSYKDAMPGNEETSIIDLASLLAQTAMTTSTESMPEPQEGETVQLPDIVLDPTIRETDAIASTLTYAPTITQSGVANPFGETSPYTFTMSGITVTSAAATFTVTATIDNPITFQVSSGGNTDISSDTDPDITQTNYPTVVSDLTPDMSDLNGRPPRTRFWAEDLCIRHERFHATDGISHARSGVTLAQNWLNLQTASSVADVNTLIGQIPARVIATRSAAMTHPGRENRAYGDGAPSYLARANAIKTKGDANGYAPSIPGQAPGRPPNPPP